MADGVDGTVLVTGAGGFAGSHLLEHLASNPNLVGWSRATIDLLDREGVRRAIAQLRPARIYHCAGAAHVAESWSRTADTLAANVLATHYLFDAVRRAGLGCRIFVPGSAHVYAPSSSPLTEASPVAPGSPYALSKLAQEQLSLRALVEDGIEIIIARVFNHIGPRQSQTFAASGMARQIAQIERGQAEPILRVGNLDSARDLTDVRDTVRAYALLMDRGTPGAIYNVASGIAHRTQEVLDTLIGLARVPVRVEVDPERLRPNDIPILVGDPSRLNAATGWSPQIPFTRMLSDLLDYWRWAVDSGR